MSFSFATAKVQTENQHDLPGKTAPTCRRLQQTHSNRRPFVRTSRFAKRTQFLHAANPKAARVPSSRRKR
jgi:hypothetical protein